MKWNHPAAIAGLSVLGLALVGGVSAGAATLASGHSTTTIIRQVPAAAPRITVPVPTPPAVRHANPAPQPTRTIYVTPPAPQAQTAQPAAPAPAPAPQLTNGVSVVLQFYQDLSDHDYQAAWDLGGSNLNGGAGYSSWVAGYDTTASISVTSYGTWSDGTVWTHISAVQDDGSVRTYDGTYTVASGVITSANMTRTS